MKPILNESLLLAHVGTVFDAADVDVDGHLTVEELRRYLSKHSWASWFLTEDYFYDFRPSPEMKTVMSKELLLNRAEDTIMYLDVDGNGVASKLEMVAALRQWSVVHKKLRHAEQLLRTKGKGAVRKFEKKYLDLYKNENVGGGNIKLEL